MSQKIDFRQQAIAQLSAQQIFPPIIQNYNQAVVLVENLPVVTPEKLKILQKKIIQSMVQAVTDKFSKNQIIINPTGGSCILSFNLISEAKDFVNKFHRSQEVFGPKYEISVKFWQTIASQLDLQPPTVREQKTLNMTKVFNHLQDDQVVSRLVLDFSNGNSQFCRFNNCLGLIRDQKFLANNIQFTPKGSFQISKGESEIFVQNEDDQFKFQYTLADFENIHYFVSKCERFLAIVLYKSIYDKTFYKVQIFSIFEEYKIFESETLQAFNKISIENHVNFSYSGNHLYLLNGEDNNIILFETQPKDSKIYKISQINKFAAGSLHQIEFSPVSDLLGVFCLKKNVPSSFFLIDGNKSEMDQKVFIRNLNISNARFEFSNSGDTVNIISDNTTKKETTTMIQQIKIAKNFPVETFKLPINQKIQCLVIYNNDVIFCDESKVYILNVQQQGKADILLELPATRLEYCEVTRTVLCIHEGSADKQGFVKTRIVFVDLQSRMTLLSLEQSLLTLAFDPYRRYIFLILKDKLVVYSTAGNQIFEQPVPQIKNLVFRPEDPKETSPSKQLRDQALQQFDTYFDQYVVMEKEAIVKRSNENADLRIKTKQSWDKAFYSEKEIQSQEIARNKRITEIRKVYPDYLNLPLLDFSIEFQLKLSEETGTITRSEFEQIQKQNEE